ncbi:hypothetical protein [Nocardioides sp.]|uniref:hypothetical protein n=1 Tax=Nocardioides sp. TaxID=35761 RepID=UPI0035181D42
MRTPRVLPALVALTGSVLAAALLAAPARAGTATIEDPLGDGVPTQDLTTVQLLNTATEFRITATVEGLRAGPQQLLSAEVRSASGEVYTVVTVRSKDGEVSTDVLRPAGMDPIPCDERARWRLRIDRIVVRVPRGCLDDGGPLRVRLAVGFGDGGSGDPTDVTRTRRVVQD